MSAARDVAQRRRVIGSSKHDGEANDHDCVVSRHREHEAFARFASYECFVANTLRAIASLLRARTQCIPPRFMPSA